MIDDWRSITMLLCCGSNFYTAASFRDRKRETAGGKWSLFRYFFSIVSFLTIFLHFFLMLFSLCKYELKSLFFSFRLYWYHVVVVM